MKLCYIIGPYRAATGWQVEQNIRAAEMMAAEVVCLHLPVYPVCPHTEKRGYFEGLRDDEYFLTGTLQLMRRCDAVLTLPRWMQSAGSRAEVAEAERIGLPVFADIDALAAWIRRQQ